MSRLLMLSFRSVIALLAVLASSTLANRLCSVYDPFKVVPDKYKFQIGGAFPLHDADCEHLHAASVQDVVAIQWALTHWNQNSQNDDARLALYAADTCTRSRESLTQTLRFLDSVGYLEPEECRTKTPGATLLGLIAPKDFNSSTSLSSLLSISSLPIAGYTLPALCALEQNSVTALVATAPTAAVYAQAFTRIMASLRSNLVTVVKDDRFDTVVRSVVSNIERSDMYIAREVSSKHPALARAIEDEDSNIILAIVSKQELIHLVRNPAIYSQNKLWIAIPAEGEVLSESEQAVMLHKDAKMRVILLQERLRQHSQFTQYFLRVLRNNYQNYELLTSYVRQVYGCHGDECNMDKEHLMRRFSQSASLESVIRLTYAFAVVGKAIAADEQKRSKCEHATPACTSLILDEILKIDYKFGINDPSELAGETLSFYKGTDGVITASGMTLDAIELFNDDDGPMAYHLLSFTAGRQPSVVASSVRSADQKLRSICHPYRSYCGQCPVVHDVDDQKHFLSIARNYPIYVLGLFDLNSGASCSSTKNSDISLPMAFVHTVWTFKQRFPQLSLLKNLEFGALLVDSCSSGRQAIETVVRSETQCFRFKQADRNITVVPGSVFGYMSALAGEGQPALKGYFSSGDTDAALVAVDTAVTQSRSFSAMPSARHEALALLRFLNHKRWQFVTVALSEDDPDSLTAFHQFERLAADSAVCLADVINISKLTASSFVASTTNVTIVFATASDAALYLKHAATASTKSVHIMMGDSHDWPLMTPDDGHSLHEGVVSIQPKDIVHSDFKEWLETTTALTLPELWFWQFIEQQWQCALSQKSKLIYGKMCTGEELIDVKRLGRMTRAGYLTRGLERFLFAMDAVYKKLCPTQSGMCTEFYQNGRRMINEQLKKASVEDDFEVYEYMANPDKATFGYRLIGNWSTAAGLRMHTSYRAIKTVSSLCTPPLCKCFLDGDFLRRPLDTYTLSEEDSFAELSGASYVRKEPAFGPKVEYSSFFEHFTAGEWRNRPINVVLLGIVTVLLILVIALLALVLLKLYMRVVKGNQSLGITLLVGIALLYITSYFFIFDPTDMVCRIRVILHGMGYTLCFGVMIAKATQLLNAEAIGYSSAHHISFWNYWLLLFFIVGVQIALATRWVAEPYMATLIMNEATCTLQREEFLWANSYPAIVLLLALFINSRNRQIKRNYKETQWLFVAAALCTVVWTLWIPCYLLAPVEYQNMVIVVELLLCGTILVSFLFGPKIYILLSYEAVVVERKATNEIHPQDLFEHDERAVSPASSVARGSGGSERGSRQFDDNQSAGNAIEDESPIFRMAMRKKKARRSNSQHESSIDSGSLRAFPEMAVIRCSSGADTASVSSASSLRNERRSRLAGMP